MNKKTLSTLAVVVFFGSLVFGGEWTGLGVILAFIFMMGAIGSAILRGR